MQVDQEEQKASGDVSADAMPEADDMTDATGPNQVCPAPRRRDLKGLFMGM